MILQLYVINIIAGERKEVTLHYSELSEEIEKYNSHKFNFYSSMIFGAYEFVSIYLIPESLYLFMYALFSSDIFSDRNLFSVFVAVC